MNLEIFLLLAQNIEQPQTRIKSKIAQLLNSPTTVIDAHCHIFDSTCVPLPYIKHTFTPKGVWQKIISRIKDIACTDIDDFLKIISFTSMKPILEYYNKYKITPNMVLFPLLIDMEYGWKHDFPKKIREQLAEVKNLMNDYDILPFFPLEPRQVDTPTKGQPNLYENFIYAFSGENCFAGVKIYPSMGFLPSDPRLLPFYKICEEKNIPITTHCGENIINTFENNYTVKGTKLINGKIEEYSVKIHDNYFGKGAFLGAPERWDEVLEMFPQLRLNFAHFGGHFHWRKYSKKYIHPKIKHIENLLVKYDNVYTDFSFNITSKKACRNLKKYLIINPQIENKIMFGTDYHIVLINSQLKKSIERFRNNFYPIWIKISNHNAKRFIGLS